MVAALDRSEHVTPDEGRTSTEPWLAPRREMNMARYLQGGAGGADARAMDEIYHFV